MSSGVYRFQYEALAQIAEDLGVAVLSTTGSFNEKFCHLCEIIVDGMGNDFIPQKGGSFVTRKASGLWQVATAICASFDTGAGYRLNFLKAAKAIYDAKNDGTLPDYGSSLDWRVYLYLKHTVSTYVEIMIAEDGTTLTTESGLTLIREAI